MFLCIVLLRLCYGFIGILCINNQMKPFSFLSGLRQIKKLDSVSHRCYTFYR